MSTTTELKPLPCPFCGNTPEPYSFKNGAGRIFHSINCDTSACPTNPAWFEKTAEEAVAVWNRRSAAHGESKAEPLKWRFTGMGGLKRYLTDKQYQAQTHGVKKFYVPICDRCGISDEQAGSAEQVGETAEAIIKDIDELTNLADKMGRSRGQNNYCNNRVALDKFVDLKIALETRIRTALQHTAPAPSKAGEWTDEQKEILTLAAETLDDLGAPHNAKELRALSSAPATVREEPAQDAQSEDVPCTGNTVHHVRAQDIDDRYAGRLALLLECMLLDPNGYWNEAANLLDEYKAEWDKINPMPPTFMGEPVLPPQKS